MLKCSRKRFSEKQAEQWWAENRARVYEQYNVRMVDKSSVGIGSEDLAQWHAVSSLCFLPFIWASLAGKIIWVWVILAFVFQLLRILGSLIKARGVEICSWIFLIIFPFPCIYPNYSCSLITRFHFFFPGCTLCVGVEDEKCIFLASCRLVASSFHVNSISKMHFQLLMILYIAFTSEKCPRTLVFVLNLKVLLSFLLRPFPFLRWRRNAIVFHE